MKYRTLGRTNFEVSEVGDGLWGMSGWTGSDDEESLTSMQMAVDLGCNFFDTAWAYGEGKSDAMLGEVMRRNSGRRLYAASKIPPGNDCWPALPQYKYREVFSPEHVFQYADRIRKQLQVDSIDVLQFHVWSDTWNGEPLYDAIVKQLRMMDISGATVYRGILGYGFTGQTHKEGFLHLSHDLPVMVSVIESAEKLNEAMGTIEGMMRDGLIVLSDVEFIRLVHSPVPLEPPDAT